MRYRPFARTSMAVSSISLALDGAEEQLSAGDWRDLVHAAFEEGVNTFEIIRPTPALMAGFAEGAAAVQRQLIFVMLRIGADADPREACRSASMTWSTKSGLENLNVLCLNAGDAISGAAPSPAMLGAMRHMKDVGLADRLAIAGEGAAIEEPVNSGVFDALITPFNLLSGWRERNLIRTALERQLGVIGAEPCPLELTELVDDAVVAAKPGWFKRAAPLAGVGTYAFLKKTPGWTIEQLCLGYALTEPALATVQVRPVSREHLTTLAAAAERDLPAAVSAQIEMARFSAEREAGAERRSAARAALDHPGRGA